jgi:chemotaxis protein methyltransferase CheR
MGPAMAVEGAPARRGGTVQDRFGFPGERPQLSDAEFVWIRRFVYDRAGIALSDSKKMLVAARLDKRLRHHRLASFGDYFALLCADGGAAEATVALDLLTTNETSFFREPEHFAFVREQLLSKPVAGHPFRAWSAASSSGEEAYSLAMLLAEHLRDEDWEVIGTDVSARMIASARRGLYPLAAADRIPRRYLENYCLRGSGEYEGSFLVDAALRGRVHFLNANLLDPPAKLGTFDLIFLRNVMIYFDAEGKRRTVAHAERMLRAGGVLVVSHSESLNGVPTRLRAVQSSIYRHVPGNGRAQW